MIDYGCTWTDRTAHGTAGLERISPMQRVRLGTVYTVTRFPQGFGANDLNTGNNLQGVWYDTGRVFCGGGACATDQGTAGTAG